jgi:hypothetical protein
MNRSIRKLVGVGAAALVLGGFFALIVAPLLAGASSGSHRTVAAAGVANVILKSRSEQTAAIDHKVATANHPATVTPTTACTTAKTNLAAAISKDKAEDATERASGTSASDLAEDKAEYGARKPLVDAVRAACGFTKPAPSAQCTAALQAMKAAFLAERSEDAAEKAAGTEGSAGDVTEDQTERAKFAPLWQAVRTSCGFGTHTGDFSTFGSTTTWAYQH